MHCSRLVASPWRAVGFLINTCLAGALLIGCHEPPAGTSPPPDVSTAGISATGSILLEGSMVVIPPPALISHIINIEAISYDAASTADASHPDRWAGEIAKALNLGVLGADLSYLINYGRTAEIPSYLAAIRRLTEDLGISNEVEPALLNQIEAGMVDPSQMLGLQSVFFQNLQKYLQSNNRSHINTCILLGGWTESMYQLSLPADSVAGHPLDRLLAEQTHSAKGIRALASSIENESFADVQASIFDVCDALDELPVTYEFRDPIHDHSHGISYLRSESNVACTDEQLVELHSLIRETRNLMIAQ